jgi:hypothetical protein
LSFRCGSFASEASRAGRQRMSGPPQNRRLTGQGRKAREAFSRRRGSLKARAEKGLGTARKGDRNARKASERASKVRLRNSHYVPEVDKLAALNGYFAKAPSTSSQRF